MTLREKIMAILRQIPAGMSNEEKMGFVEGHKQARYAAAEIATAADALILELAESLRDACEWLDSVPLGGGPIAALSRYRAMIAKATKE